MRRTARRSGGRHSVILVGLVIAAVVMVIYLRGPLGDLLEPIDDGGLGFPRAQHSDDIDGREPAVVERVVDGDTIVVQLDGKSERVRLLNIDTPESVDPDRDVECLGPEASDYLTARLPAGAAVTLEFDSERRDRYDRLLAGVFTSDGAFVNAQIAAAGFAELVVFGSNDRFEPDIRAAISEAQNSALGLWADAPAC